jgi:hypothetical protein
MRSHQRSVSWQPVRGEFLAMSASAGSNQLQPLRTVEQGHRIEFFNDSDHQQER